MDPARLALIAVTLAGLAKLLDVLDFNEIDPAVGWTMLIVILALGLCVVSNPVAGPATVVFGLAIGVRERLSATPFQGSDVLLATNEAIRVMVSGGNPYSHYYRDTIPDGSPFPYPIGEPVFYWIHQTLFGRIDYADLWSGILILGLFAGLSPVIGWVRSSVAVMAYSLSSEAVLNAAGGSNDTSLALFLILGLTFLVYSLSRRTAARWRLPLLIISAVFFGWALLFKLFALIIVPFIVLALRQRNERWVLFSVVSFGVAGLAMSPYLLDDAAGVIDYVSRGGAHDEIWGFNLWTLLRPDAPEFVEMVEPRISSIQYPATAAVGLFLILRRRTDPGRAVLAGLMTCLSLIFLANWTTSAYYVGFLPIVVIAAVIVGSPALAVSTRTRAASPISVLPLADWLGRRFAGPVPSSERVRVAGGPRAIMARPMTLGALHRRSLRGRIARWRRSIHG